MEQRLDPSKPPATRVLNGLENIEGKAFRLRQNRRIHHSQSSARNRGRDSGSSRGRFGPYLPPVVLTRIEIVGPDVSETQLLHRRLRLKGHQQVAQGVPCAGDGSRPFRSGFALSRLGRFRNHRQIPRLYTVVYKRGEGLFVRVRKTQSAVLDPFAWDATAIGDLLDHQLGCDHCDADQGHYGAAAQLKRLIAVGNSSHEGEGYAARDWNNTEGGLWWTAATHQEAGACECRQYVARGSYWGTFYRGAHPQRIRMSLPSCETVRGLWRKSCQVDLLGRCLR